MITSEEPQVTKTGRYTVVQAAKVLGCCRQTVLQMSKSGQLRTHYKRTIKDGRVQEEPGRKFFYGADILSAWRAIYA